MKQWIGVLDCNNFFVSCERLFRPDLQNKPVVVLSGNDGCIVARSQEIKDMGVPMGVPYFQVKDILKKADTITFSSHFALYRDISRRVFEVMRQELDQVEQYSIDEAFFRLPVSADPTLVAQKLKTVVQKTVGIPVSIGVAHTKTQAKYASKIAKKTDGVAVISTQQWLELSATIRLAELWGVGARLEHQYKAHQLITVADLLRADTSRVQKLFGVIGARLQQEVSGHPAIPFEAKKEKQKTIMSSRSFKDTTTDLAVLLDAVAYHVRHAMADLRAMGMQTMAIRVALYPSRHGDFVLRGGSTEAVLTAPTADTTTVLRAAHDLVLELFKLDVPYKKAGIVLSQFTDSDGQQGVLFQDQTVPDTTKLMSLIDSLNAKEGRELVQIGSRLQGVRWQSRSDVRSPAYTTRWQDVAVAKAG